MQIFGRSKLVEKILWRQKFRIKWTQVKCNKICSQFSVSRSFISHHDPAFGYNFNEFDKFTRTIENKKIHFVRIQTYTIIFNYFN